MESSAYALVFLVFLSSQYQVVTADNTSVAIGAGIGFLCLIGLAVALGYFSVGCKSESVKSRVEPVERKVNTGQNNDVQIPVGAQPYQGERPPNNWQQPMPQSHMGAPPMHNDPAYPPPMPAGGYGHNQPAANPFKSASYGH